uniref:hypothetical protein n=1 Tax=Microcoleus sp. CAWBG640 TaxID=2841653 RepID=UPI00312B8540
MIELISSNLILNQDKGKSNLEQIVGLTNPLLPALDPKLSVGSDSNLVTSSSLASKQNITTGISVINSKEIDTLILPLSSTSQIGIFSNKKTSQSIISEPEIDIVTGLRVSEELVDNSQPDSLTNPSTTSSSSNSTNTGSVTETQNQSSVVVTDAKRTNSATTDKPLLEDNGRAIASTTEANITLSPPNGSTSVNLLDNDDIIRSKGIVEKLSSVKTVFSALSNSITQNSLFTQNISPLPNRFDSAKATVFLNDVSARVNKTLATLTDTPNLDLKIIVEQLSKSIENIGTLTVAIDGQLITPDLINTIKLGIDTEVVFNFDFSKSFTISENLTGETAFEIAGTKTQATVSGNANGLGAFDFNFSIGIDKVGKVFINEGGLLSSDFDLNATLAGNAPIKGLVNTGINGTGTLNLDAQLKIDDGDTILNERLYLNDDTAITLFAPSAASFTGGIVLDKATVKGSIPALSELELAIAASGSLNFVTGEAKLAVQQDALLDALVNATEKGINSLANQSAKIAKLTQDIPIIGDDLSTALSSTIKKGLGFDAPDKGTKAYLESFGITVEKLITPEQFFSGNFIANDVLLLHYNSSVSDTLQLANTSGGFDAGSAKFTLNGNLQATPNLAFDLSLGLDLANGPFILEGGNVNAQLPIKGSFNGTASIGKFLTGQVSIDNANLSPTAKLTFSDFDSVGNERFYLLGSNNTLSLDTILGKKEAIALTGNLALDAALTVANPAQNLKVPLLNKLNLGNFTWNAGVQYDLATGKADYTIKNDASLTAIANLFQGKQGDIINLFLGDLVGSNPIPKEIRTILTEKIPLLDKNLLDIIGVPKGLQILIEPDKFQGKSIEQINDKTGQQGLDILDLSFDLIKTDNVLKLLSGQDINLISLDVKQTLASFEKKITVLPSTTVFTFYGLAGISAGVDIEARLSMLVDTIVGFDTQGFYVVESGAKKEPKDILGRTVGNMLFSLNPTITGILTGTLDLITVLDLIDIAGRVSLIGQLGLRLDDSPSGVDSDPKVRLAGLNKIDEILRPTLKLDLGFGLTSTLFPIGNFGLPLIKKGEVEKIVPLYNESAGSLADIKNDVKSFIDKTRGEGGLKVYALGVITGDPTLLTAGTALVATSPPVTQAFSELATGLKESGRDMLGAAKSIAEVAKEYGLNLAQTAKFLYQEFSGGVAGVANALYNGVTQNIGDIAGGLYNGVTENIGDIAKGLYNGVTQNLGTIAGGLYNGVTKNIGSVAKGLYDGVTTNLGSVARGLYNGVTSNLDSIAKGLYDGVSQDIDKIAKAIIDEFGVGFFFKLDNLITEFLPDGSKIRNTFINGVNTFREEWLSGGKKIDTAFRNGTTYLRNTFINGVNTFREEWLSGGKKIDTAFRNGTTYLRNTFINGVNT